MESDLRLEKMTTLGTKGPSLTILLSSATMQEMWQLERYTPSVEGKKP